jgi:hypothetical protein
MNTLNDNNDNNELDLKLSNIASLPSTVQAFGNPLSVADSTFTEVMSFQGGQYLEFDSSMVGKNIEKYTIEAWVWLDEYSESTIFVAQIDTKNTFALLTIGFTPFTGQGKSGIVYFHPANASANKFKYANASGKALSLKQWHHIAATSDGTEFVLYVDGQQVAAQPGHTTIPFTDNAAQVNSVGSWYFAGAPHNSAKLKMANFSFSSTALSPLEVHQAFSSLQKTMAAKKLLVAAAATKMVQAHINQKKATAITAANQLKENAHKQAASKLLQAHDSARAMASTAKFEQIFFLKNGHIHCVSPDGSTEDLQLSNSPNLFFSCLALDPVNKRLFAGAAASPFEIYQVHLEETKISSIRAFCLLKSSPLAIDYNGYDNCIYWLGSEGNICKEKAKAKTEQVALPLSDLVNLPAGVKVFGNPQSITDPTFGEVMSFQGQQYLEFESSMIGKNIEKYTIEAWVWLDEYNESTIFVAQIDNKNSFAFLSIGCTFKASGKLVNDGFVYFRPSDEIPYISSKKALSLKQWHHIAATSDASNYVLYIDGQQVAHLEWETRTGVASGGISRHPKTLQKTVNIPPTSIPFTANVSQVNCIGTWIESSKPNLSAILKMASFSFASVAKSPQEITQLAKQKEPWEELLHLGKKIGSGDLTIDTDLQQGLQGSWIFSSNTGFSNDRISLYDLSGHNLPATLSSTKNAKNGAGWQSQNAAGITSLPAALPTKFGEVYQFHNLPYEFQAYFSVPENKIDFSQGFSVEIWLTCLTPGVIMRWGNDSSSDSITLALISGTNDQMGLSLTTYNGANSSGFDVKNIPYTAGWYFISATIDNMGNAVLYVNGGVVTTNKGVALNTVLRKNNYFGNGGWGNGDIESSEFDGAIGSIKVFNRVRTANQIKKNYVDSYNSSNNLIAWSDETAVWLINKSEPPRMIDELPGNSTAPSVVLDSKSGKVFWIDSFKGAIMQANVSGGQSSVLCKVGHFACGLAVDPINSQLYWTQSAGQLKLSPDGLLADWVLNQPLSSAIPGRSDLSMLLNLHDTEWLQDNSPPTNNNEWVLNFDGVQSFATIPTFYLDIAAGFCFEVWVNFDLITREMVLLSLGNKKNKEEIFLSVNSSGTLSAGIVQPAGNSSISFSNNIDAHNWNHIAFTIDKTGKLICFINGKPLNNATLTLPTSVYWDVNFIGKKQADGPAEFFNGNIAAMRLWDKTRDANEISNDMNMTVSSTLLMTCSEKGKVEAICPMPLSRSLCLLSKGVVDYDQMLESMHSRKIAQLQASNDVAVAYKNATLQKALANAEYEQNSQNAHDKITTAQNQAALSKRQAHINLLTAQNNARQKVRNATLAATSTRHNAELQSDQIKQNAQQKKQNMLEKANAKLAGANAEKAKYN